MRTFSCCRDRDRDRERDRHRDRDRDRERGRSDRDRRDRDYHRDHRRDAPRCSHSTFRSVDKSHAALTSKPHIIQEAPGQELSSVQ